MQHAQEGDLVFVDRSGNGSGHPLAFRDTSVGRDLGTVWNEETGVWRWRFLADEKAGRSGETRGTVTSRGDAMMALIDAHRHSTPEASARARAQYHRRLDAREGTYPVI